MRTGRDTLIDRGGLLLGGAIGIVFLISLYDRVNSGAELSRNANIRSSDRWLDYPFGSLAADCSSVWDFASIHLQAAEDESKVSDREADHCDRDHFTRTYCQ